MLMLLVSFGSFGQINQGANPSIGGRSNGESISKTALVAAGKITINQEDRKVNFFMMSYLNKQTTAELSSNSENLTPEMKTAINNLPSGSKIQFIKISCKMVNNPNAAPERVREFSLIVQ